MTALQRIDLPVSSAFEDKTLETPFRFDQLAQ
jgi:hypothetical protein